MERNVHALRGRRFDVLVIGGGIYGAWTAYDAALRGLSVALVERHDWACATSSASTKLIHGGLRYLEHFDLKLVRRSLAERRRLAHLAPHRIAPIRFLIPVYRGARVGRYRMRAGLTLYDMLAGRRQPVGRHRAVSRSTIMKRYPFLNRDGLVAGFTYGDCQTDDARFTLEIVAGAAGAGAVAVNYVEAIEVHLSGRGANGASLRDVISGDTFEIEAEVIVNTAGAWAPGVGAGDSGGVDVRMTKGVHLVLPPLATSDAMLMTARRDGRVFFLIPWYDKMLVGTTDTDYDGDPGNVAADPEDIDYLLSEANRMFAGSPYTPNTVIASFAGIRALKNQPGRAPSSVTRDWFIAEPRDRYIVSIGGKFTSARADAAEIVDRVMRHLGRSVRGGSPTDARPFPWSPRRAFADWLHDRRDAAHDLGIDDGTAQQLLSRYGTCVDSVFDLVRERPELGARIVSDVPFAKAEIVHAARSEMVRTLEDILRRRVPLLLLSRPDRRVAEAAAALAGSHMEWDEPRQHGEAERLMAKWETRPTR